ncbi:amino acid adenylation domain-containing protein, partial [Myxococcaceae bacterium JPH2]|nr:amino acid adenylation domain-containing protein [Myxococcaceae bacterium JPH2]
TSHGKLDRRALPPPEATDAAAAAHVAPRTPTEELLAGLWAEVLRLERVGAEDDFFALGGHSLLATQVVARLRSTFRIDLPLRALFESPTVARLAANIDAVLQAHHGSEIPPLVPTASEADAPLSFAQQRLWFLDQLQPGTGTYNMPRALRLEGLLDVAALERAFTELLHRHAALRTSFPQQDGEPTQRITPSGPFALEVLDLSAREDREDAARRLTEAEASTPFLLATGPAIRVRLLRLEARRHILLLTMHHIVSDGWTMGILVRELSELYQAFTRDLPSPLSKLGPSYADYARWQRSWLQGEHLDQQREWWRKQLAGANQALELPTDFPRPPTQSFDGATLHFQLPLALSESLQALGRKHGATLFMTLLASIQTLLARHAGQEDIVVGSPIAGRRFAELEGLVGLFVNTIALRSRLDDDPTFVQLLGRVREATLGAYAHQDIPFEKLVEELQPRRDLSRAPLFQAMLILQNAPQSVADASVPDALTIQPIEVDNGAAKFDLTFTFTASSQGLVGALNYATALFQEDTARRMLARLRVLLEAVVQTPESRVQDLPLLTSDERREVLRAWNDTARPFDATCLHLQFEAQASRTPDALAVAFGDTRLTYRQLHERVLRMSRQLRDFGLQADERVALCVRRSPDMVVALLAILHAGGAYVPLDPAYPIERLTWMLQDSGAKVLLTQRDLLGFIPAEGLPTVLLDEVAQAPESALPPSDVRADNLAYIIYTSGSTGRPKGVMVTHRTAANFLHAMDALLDKNAGGTWLAVTSISFDIHVLELLWTLSRGFHVVLHDEQAAARGAALPLPEVLRRHTITHLQCTPPFARALLLAPESLASLGALRHLMMGGEALPRPLAEQLKQVLPSTALTNMYGPTEVTVWSSTHTVASGEDSATVSIGAPVANTQYYVLDTKGRPTPRGVPGELFIAGAGVVRGYHGRPELTAERFIPDAYSDRPGARMYRTGDLARWRHDGTLDFLGRTDFQVKVRGFRIELGEVEAVLARHEAVRQAVVGAQQDSAGDGRLVAWVVPTTGNGVSASALREYARKHLPEHMVPSLVVPMDAFPLTPSGKVDRKALPSPDTSGLERRHVPPATEAEQRVADIYAELLGVPTVGATDGFFELGGHSLLATRLMSRIRNAFAVELPLQVVFEAPTVAALAARIEASLRTGAHAARAAIEPVSRTDELPATHAQQRLWLLDQLAPGSPAYNIPIALPLSGTLDVEALRQALEALVHRHESLRTRFREGTAGPVQVIEAPSSLTLDLVDLREQPREHREAEAARLAEADAQRPFDLGTGPLLRASLIVLEEHEHVLLLNVHHIISDGWSLGVMVREMAELYRGFTSGTPARLAPLPYQFVDHAVWQRRWLESGELERQLAWWKTQLDDVPRELELPTDRPRVHRDIPRGEHLSVNLPLALSEALEAFCIREGVTPYMFLLAGFQLLLARYSGQDDINVGSPLSGRDRSEMEGLVGFFTNTVVMRTRLGGDPTVRELLRRVRTTTLDAFAHQHVPYEQLQPMRDLRQAPLFQVMFILQNMPPAELAVTGLTFRHVTRQPRAAKFDLTLTLLRGPQGFTGDLEYASDLFDPSTVARMMRHLETLLAAFLAKPEQRVSTLDLLGGEERAQLLFAWNDTRADFPDACIHTLFEAQARRAPRAIAARYEGVDLTYQELDARANQLAHALRRRGVGPETRVALSVERSLDVVIGLLGILKSGGAWVPVDPQLPRERLAFMLEDSEAAALVTRASLLERFPASLHPQALCLDTDAGTLARESAEAPRSGVTPEHLAYLLYTSGSTGKPKGTAIIHRAVANLVTHEAVAYGIGPGSRVLQFASLSFDLSVEEIFTTLCTGGTLVLAPLEKLMPGVPLQEFLRAEALTVISLTPAALAATSPEGLPALRTVISGGEALPVDVLARWAPSRTVLNTYGPTEATVVATLAEVRADGRRPSIGRPLANVRAYVLDAQGSPVPIGVKGELYLGGVGVARGYPGRPSLTAERFIPDALGTEPGARLYRTGDVVRWRDDGTLDFVGRADAQVKVRGFRIELGEVEAALARLPQVREAVVLAREDGPGGKRLVGYVVAHEGVETEGTQVREALKAELPEYMVPSAVVVLPRLPLTSNGKVDRKALPAPDYSGDARAYVAPATPTEEQLAALYGQLLGVPRVSARDSFFDLGGHSLLATQAISRIRQGFAVELPLRTLFEAPTVEGLARRIDSALAGQGLSPTPRQARARPVLPQPILPLEEAAANEALRPTPVEEQGVPEAWNATDTAYAPDAYPVRGLAEQAARHPERLAVEGNGTRLTYRELYDRVLRISGRLQALGVRADDRVALCVRRSPEMVAAMYAIHHAGAAYLPLDPSYPVDRLGWMLQDSGARVLITESPLLGLVPTEDRTVVLLDEAMQGPPATAEGAVHPDNIAYVIYTSGSTGRPKGVMVPHRAVTNFLPTLDGPLESARPGTWLAVTSISFDIHVLELLWTLSRGLQVILHDEHAAARGTAPSLSRLLRENTVTHFQCTPAFSRSLVLAPDSLPFLGSLRHMIVGGEALSGPLGQSLRAALPQAALTNMYGPTETTVYSTRYPVPEGELPATVSIGTPLANTRVYVLDAEGQRVPVGVPGELYIAGDGVVRGYHGRPDLTAERFVPDPFSTTPGARMYRSGDLTHWSTEGTLEFMGRTDFQVKVRGFRIELGEVEAVLARHPDVRQVVAGAHRDASGDGRLVAWVVPQPGMDVNATALREHARQHLPEHMVPSLFTAMESFPLTPNGKVDRKALPAPDASGLAHQYVAPASARERQVADLYASLLRVGRVGALDSFFELGGHSLSATQVLSRIRQSFGVDLPLSDFFSAATVRAVARRIDEEAASQPVTTLPALRARQDIEHPPLSFAQQRLWFLAKLEPDSASYNIPVAVLLDGVLDVAALAGAFRDLQLRHESLRTTFHEHAHQPFQHIEARPALPASWVDLSGPSSQAADTLVRDLFQYEAWLPFDVETGPLWRVLVARLSEERHALLLTMHHAISDGWSMGVLIQELTALYSARATGVAPRLEPLPIQYADFALWQRDWLRDDVLEAQLDWWKGQLQGAPSFLALPTDKPRPATRSVHGAAHPFQFPRELSDALHALCRQEGVTPSMVILAAFQLLLSWYSGQDDISVGSPIAGRTQPELEGLIGFFVNTLVLRTRLDGVTTFRELLDRVRTLTLGAYAHQDVPFEKLVEALRPERVPGRSPLFQVMVAYQNAPMPEVLGPQLRMSPYKLEHRAALFDLTLAISDRGQGLRGQLEYSTDLFEPSTAARIVGHLRMLLESVLANPSRPLATVSLLTEDERRLLMERWRDADAATLADASLYRLFKAKALATPDALAAEWEGHTLTWRELHERARTIYRALLAQGVLSLPAAPPVVAVPRTESLPLSFAQQRLWLIHQLEPDSPSYNIPSAVRLEGALHVDALQQGLSELVRRHEALRTLFQEHAGNPVQRILPPTPLELTRVDLMHLGAGALDEARRLVFDESTRGFDLAKGPLLRASLLKLKPEEHLLVLNMHHIVSDGWSMGVLVRELAALYQAFSERRPSPLPELPLQYADFAVWQRKWLDGDALDAQLTYWKRQLTGAPAMLELPTDKPRPAVQTSRGAYVPVQFSTAQSEALATLCQREGVTPFMALLALWQVLLARYSGQEDISVGSPIAGRQRGETESLIGFFVNTLVLRGRVEGARSFRQLVQDAKETALGAYAHQDLPFEKLVEELQPQRSLSHSPLFQVLLVLQNTPATTLALPGLTFLPFERDFEAAKADLTLSLVQAPTGLSGWLGYRTDLFERRTVLQLVEHLRTLMDSALANPEARLDSLSWLTASERTRVLETLQVAPLVETPPRLLHTLIAEQAAQHPERPAVASEGRVLTYGELDARANQLAWHLRELGVGPDARVALCLERSVDTVIALLGIWKAGGAYVPMDPAQPSLRLQSLVEEIGAAALVTVTTRSQTLQTPHTPHVCLDGDAPRITRHPTSAPSVTQHPEQLAYVLFTSGSTGRPKGVGVTHANLHAYVEAVTERLSLTECASFAMVSTFVADLGNTVLFPALRTGGWLHVLSQECASSPDLLAEYFRRHAIDCMKIVPSHLSALLTARHPRDVLPRKRLVLGGESSTWPLLETVHALAPECEVHNHYGPTETTVGVLAGRVTMPVPQPAPTSVPLGWPLAGTRLYVLDATLRPVPMGVPGELYVAGAQVTRGYLGRPELTAERYVPDLHAPTPGARMYRTGDRVRWLTDGRVEFLGRVDFQVKVRGFRVEPGEVAQVLRELPTVNDVVVVARADATGDQRLVAYVVPASLSASELREALQQRLPEYMVPSTFVLLDALPLTPNGKVDRNALPAPTAMASTVEHVAPATEQETQVARAFAEVLRLERVGAEDDFFQLGGHSLLAVRLMALLRERTGVALPLAALFQGSTVRRLAARLEAGVHARRPNLARLDAGRAESRPVFFIHGGGGEVLSYTELVHQLGDAHVLYGVSAPGLEGGALPPPTMEALVRHYLEQLRDVQPSGPYRLAGWSFGGVAAYELARQLEALGEQVELLALLDSYAPSGTPEPEPPPLARLARFAKMLGVTLDDVPEDELERLTELRGQEQVTRMMELVRTMPTAGALDAAQAERVFSVHERLSEAQRGYVPASPFGGTAHFFPAESRRATPGLASDGGWSTWIHGGLTVCELPGDHQSILQAPQVATLAEHLKALLLALEEQPL